MSFERKYINNAPDVKDCSGRWLRVYSDGHGTKSTTRGGRLWDNLVSRCSSNYQKRCKSYEGTENKFADFQSFMEWAILEQGYLNKENGRFWQIDKDFLGCGKVYSEDTCLFLPTEINCLFNDGSGRNGLLPGVGVYKYNNSKYTASCRVGGVSSYSGLFETEKDAHLEWCRLKTKEVSDLMFKYQDYEKICKALSLRVSRICQINHHNSPIS